MSFSDYALRCKLGAEPSFDISMAGIAITAIAELMRWLVQLRFSTPPVQSKKVP
jgi:hypothetical protein